MVGKLVNVMLENNSGNSDAVINQLKRDGVPARLKGYVEYLPKNSTKNNHEDADT